MTGKILFVVEEQLQCVVRLVLTMLARLIPFSRFRRGSS